MLSALSAAKKRTQPPLWPTDIRLILVIRDLLISFFVILVNSFYSCENGRVSRFNSGDLAGKCAASNRQQKIALRAENNCSSLIMFGSGWIFCAFAQFSAGIGPAHFPAETTRLLSRGCLPFSPKIRYKIFLDFSNYIIHDNS